jgi:hypothetical protein
MATVLKHFKWAPDGVTLEYLAPGDVRDFGDITAGLESEGFVTSLTGLLGSSRLPSVINAYDKSVALGDLVRQTFDESGLAADEWNGLAEADRDERLEVVLRRIMYAQPAPVEPSSAAAEPPAQPDVETPASEPAPPADDDLEVVEPVVEPVEPVVEPAPAPVEPKKPKSTKK